MRVKNVLESPEVVLIEEKLVSRCQQFGPYKQKKHLNKSILQSVINFMKCVPLKLPICLQNNEFCGVGVSP